MYTEIYWIEAVSSGRLGIASRPRGGDWLEDELRTWRIAGVDSVVSLLTPPEEEELELEAEEAICVDAGIRFRSLRIPDRGLPPSRREVDRLAADLWDELAASRSVVVHCRQGIGRSSLILAIVLLSTGLDPDAALHRIGQARGRPVPDTEEQRQWVRDYAAVAAIVAS